MDGLQHAEEDSLANGDTPADQALWQELNRTARFVIQAGPFLVNSNSMAREGTGQDSSICHSDRTVPCEQQFCGPEGNWTGQLD